MQIMVNGENLDFEMSQKTALEDILGHISDWARKENAYIIDYRVDGNEVSSTAKYHSENIGLLEVSLGSADNLLMEHLLELEDYLDKMGTHLALQLQRHSETGEKIELSTEVFEGLLWIADSVEAITQKQEPAGVNGLEALRDEPAGILSNLAGVLQVLIDIRHALVNWKRNMTLSSLSGTQRSELRMQFLGDLEASLEQLESVVQNFTMGKEAQALSQLESYMTWLSEGLTILETTDSDAQLSEAAMQKLAGVKTLLAEMHDALENADFVTLADILDYDLREVIEGLAKEAA